MKYRWLFCCMVIDLWGPAFGCGIFKGGVWLGDKLYKITMLITVGL